MAVSRDDALLAMVTGWMMHAGPVTSQALACWLGLPLHDVEKVLLRLEAAGSVLRGISPGRPRATTPVTPSGATAAGAHSSPHRRYAARTGRAGNGSTVHAVAITLAACCTAVAIDRRARIAGSCAPVAGLRNTGRTLAKVSFLFAHDQVRDPAELDPNSVRESRWLGQALAASSHTGGFRRGPTSPSVAPITFFVREAPIGCSRVWAEEEQSYERVLSEGAQLVP